MSGAYTTAEAQVLAPILMARSGGIHDAVVIEGIEHRCKIFDREIPTEASIRAVIQGFLDNGNVVRNADGWLVSVYAKGAT